MGWGNENPRGKSWFLSLNKLPFKDADAKTIADGDRLTGDMPAAKAADGPPPFWLVFS